MSIENNTPDSSGGNSSSSGIVTPDQVRQESCRQDQDITVNSAGDTKEAGSDTATTPSGEPYTPTPNQNDVNIEEYQAVETDTYVTAEKVDDKTLQAREKATQELMSGRATWRNDKQQFTKQGEGRLHATGDQMETAREEMNATLNSENTPAEVTGPNKEAKEKEIAQNRQRNQGVSSTGISEGQKEFFQDQQAIADKAKEQARWRATKVKEIDKNRERNQGMTSTGMSEGQKEFAQEQQGIADKAKEEARWRQAKDKEVARNRELNAGVSPVDMSKGMRKFSAEQDEISRRAREQNIMPQEISGREGPQRPEVNPLETIDQRLAAIDSQLVDIQGRLDQLIESQEFSNLNNEQLLEYIKLSTAQSSLRMSRLEALLEKQTTQTTRMINNIQNNLNMNVPAQPQLEGQEQQPRSTTTTGTEGQGQAGNAPTPEGESEDVVEQQPEVTSPPHPEGTQQPIQESEDGSAEEVDPLEAINGRITNIDQQLEGIQVQLDQLLENQDLENLGREQLLEYVRLSTLQSNLQMSRFEALIERQAIETTNTINNLTNNINIGGGGTPETLGDDGENGTEPTPPEGVSDSDRITQLENELRRNQQELSDFRGENTPEQKSLALSQELTLLEDKERTQGLTDEEKVQWFNLDRQKEAIDNQINQEQQESRRKRERKEKIIKIIAGVAGGAIALASPPVGIAAVVGVTLGGRFVGKGLKKWSEKLRNKSNAMRYEGRRGKTPLELAELDRKIQRREWWADRLGEASAVTLGGSTGYGLGKAVQNIFGWKGIGGGGNTPPEGGVPGSESTGTEGGGNTPPDLNKPPEGDIGGPQNSFELPQAPESVGGGAGEAEWFNASDYGWDAQQLGWRGNRVALGAHGSAEGTLQKEFFGELFNLVPKENLMGQTAGNTANQFLRQAYNGVDPTRAAQNAAQALLGQ